MKYFEKMLGAMAQKEKFRDSQQFLGLTDCKSSWDWMADPQTFSKAML